MPRPPKSTNPPLQERSRQTLERMLVATEELLETESFQDIGIHDIVQRAKASVGSFYARFADKDALLTALYERYDAELPLRIERWRRKNPEPGESLQEACTWVARYLMDSFGERTHLLRALALHVRGDPSLASSRTSQRRAKQHAFLEDALLRFESEIPDAVPRRAVRTAIFLAASACRERLLFEYTPHGRAARTSRARLGRDLARMMAGYLGGPHVSGEQGRTR